ncbi:dTMP kinase [Candidatus Saccharibacteria bacterium]|nr:dTMP kinase [Candidatus Saccharibacteria bacterium]
MTERGRYIVIEGGEHVGKTTQVGLLAEQFELFPVREPGGTKVGEQIRNILLDNNAQRATTTDVLLHAAARAELIDSVVNPTLDTGQHVISDRSWISGAAYQGAQGVPLEQIMTINQIAAGDRFTPDLLIFLSARPSRVAERAAEVQDYYEQQSEDFHNQVFENYVNICNDMGAIIIEAISSIEEVNRKASQQVADVIRIAD